MSEKKYTKDHEWVSIENEIATIGISNHAQESLGDIVFIELPSVGNSVKAKDEICVVESVKAASEVYSPVSGTIIKSNEDLNSTPEIVNEDPVGKGWFYEIKISNNDELSGLMSEEEYQKHIGD
jgi:glycine cleavage system H protein